MAFDAEKYLSQSDDWSPISIRIIAKLSKEIFEIIEMLIVSAAVSSAGILTKSPKILNFGSILAVLAAIYASYRVDVCIYQIVKKYNINVSKKFPIFVALAFPISLIFIYLFVPFEGQLVHALMTGLGH